MQKRFWEANNFGPDFVKIAGIMEQNIDGLVISGQTSPLATSTNQKDSPDQEESNDKVLQPKQNVVTQPKQEETTPGEWKEPQKLNCVICDSHFLDLLALERHVKGHKEVLHFSILLKKVGKENEERTRNAIASLIELAKSSDVNITKFRSFLAPDRKRSRILAPRRNRLNPRKNKTDGTEEHNSDHEHSGGTNVSNLAGNDISSASSHQSDFAPQVGDEVVEEEQVVKDVKVESSVVESKVLERQDTCAQDQWSSVIAESESQRVKKEGPGRPAYGLNCPVCDVFITGRTNLKLHMRKEHGKLKTSILTKGLARKSHSCEMCGLKLKSLNLLKSHLLTDHGIRLSSGCPKRHKCPLCEAVFGRRGELKAHRSTEHPGQSEHVCKECGKTLASASLLEKHSRSHTGEKPFKCDLCPKAFTINTKLQQHLRQHTGEKPFVCDICGAKFNRSCNKKRHMLIHEGKYPHTCEHCGKGFRDIGPLTLHIRRHTGEKPYKCEEQNCGMAFITRGELECHRAKHTQKREHLCCLCGAEFLYKGDLRRHVKLHTGERPHKCSDCNAAFTRNQHLKHHWQSHHANGARMHKEWKPRKKSEPFGLIADSSTKSEQCSTSDMLAIQNSSAVQSQPSPFLQQQASQLLQHPAQQQQNHVCAMCNQWFSSEAALKTHSTVVHTVEHMFLGMPASGQQDYAALPNVHNLSGAAATSVEVCAICNVLLAEPGSLQTHMQNVHGQFS